MLPDTLISVQAAGKCPVGPILGMYDRLLGDQQQDLTSQFATSAWWGGQGNTVPATMWTFGMILNNPEWKKLAYQEVGKYAIFTYY